MVHHQIYQYANTALLAPVLAQRSIARIHDMFGTEPHIYGFAGSLADGGRESIAAHNFEETAACYCEAAAPRP
jgi:hypothetical protein